MMDGRELFAAATKTPRERRIFFEVFLFHSRETKNAILDFSYKA